MWSIDVVTTRDDGRKLEGAVVGLYDELCSSLRSSIRVRWFEDLLLKRVLALILAVHLIGAHVDEALDARRLGRLEEHVGAEHVRGGKV